jgi:Flp pilus assembly pilin Flp
MRDLKTYLSDRSGATSVEAAFISGMMVAMTVTVFEIGYGFHQWNTAQQAARVGARIAAISAPIAQDLNEMTGLGGGVEAGDPLPDYSRLCSGLNRSCSSGAFNAQVMDEIVYGPDNDGVCAKTARERRGMCDLFPSVKPENFEIEYRSSGMGRAGEPASPAPLITVTLKDIDYALPVIGRIAPKAIRKMPAVKVTVMAEDMKSGS